MLLIIHSQTLPTCFSPHRLLADVYEVDGVEKGRYHEIVRHILGSKFAIGVSTFQLLNIFLINIAYTITAGNAMRTLATTACEWQGIESSDCWNTTWKLTLIFGTVEIFSSQVANLEEAWWVSVIGVFTSLFYSFVALSLGLKHASNRLGSVGGLPGSNVEKAFEILNALGAIGFAYSFSTILVEIQDTLKQPPKASVTMTRAISIAVTGSFLFYFIVAIGGYASLGDDVPSYILDGLPGPKWVIFVSNFCVLLHMWSAYQIFAHPMFDTLESNVAYYILKKRGTDAETPAKQVEGKVDAPKEGAEGAEGTLRRLSRASAETNGRLQRVSAMYRVSTGFVKEEVLEVNPNAKHVSPVNWWQRFIIRTIYVIITTIIGVVMPFFGAMAGLVGALAFYPLTVFFPVYCWRRVYKPQGWFNNMLWVVDIFMLLVCIGATIASVRNIINSWSTFKIFGD